MCRGKRIILDDVTMNGSTAEGAADERGEDGEDSPRNRTPAHA